VWGKKKLDPAAYLATWIQGGGGGDKPLYSNLKLIAVAVFATILHTAPLISHRFKIYEWK